MRKLILDFKHLTEREPGVYLWMSEDGSGDPSDLSTLSGHWSSVVVEGGQVRLACDTARSRPLYFAQSADRVLVTDDWSIAVERVGYVLDRAGFEQIAMCGFTFGQRTVAEGVFQVDSGQQVVLGLESLEWESDYRFLPQFWGAEIESRALFEQKLQDALLAAVQRLVDSTSGDLVIPLSGGYDSRLIALALSQVCPERTKAFTYGLAGSREMATSKSVARTLGIRWFGVDIDPKDLQRRWLQPQTAQFLEYCFAGFALPHVQDWYALEVLTERGWIQPGDTVVPGHTIVDNVHDAWVLDDEPVRATELAQVLFEHHCVMHPRFDTGLGRESLLGFIHDFMGQMGFDGSVRSAERVLDSFNEVTRQGHYINNSVRAYEFYGLNWSMPMLQRIFTDVYSLGSIELTATRTAYENWIDRWWLERLGSQPSKFESPAQRLRIPRRVRQVAKKVGVGHAVSWALRVHTSLHHPLGFDLLRGQLSRPEQALLFAFGQPSNGPWLDQFLRDQWHPDLQLFEQSSAWR